MNACVSGPFTESLPGNATIYTGFAAVAMAVFVFFISKGKARRVV